jgi:CheY-like chemotaxis protein
MPKMGLSAKNNSSEFERSELRGTRVLVVEDSWDVSRRVTTLLEAHGAEVVGPVATTNDARRLCSQNTPDVALVDINLRTGELSYGLIDEMRAMGIPIIVITGYANASPAAGAAVAVLQKPFSEAELLAALRSAKSSGL